MDPSKRREPAPAAMADPKKPLTPAAERALAEAAARRAERERTAAERANEGTKHGSKEHGGRGGLDPVRYGDWEVKGLASDF
jgi:hypothetical protein